MLAIYVVLSCLTSPFAPMERVNIGELASSVFALSGFGFSISIGAIALVLALPQSQTLRNMTLNALGRPKVDSARTEEGLYIWAKNAPNLSKDQLLKDGRTSLFSSLVFVFVWTGFAQVLASFVAFACQLFAGKSVVLTKDDVPGLIAGSLIVFTLTYALVQLVSAISAMADIAKGQEEQMVAEAELINRGGPSGAGDQGRP